MSLALAIALKCTALLFVPYFMLKRQWRMVMTTLLFTGVFTILPILRYGPSGYALHMSTWIRHAVLGTTASSPEHGYAARTDNMSLKPAMAPFLMRLDDHIDGSASLNLFDMSPKTARLVIYLVMLALIVWVGWRFRQPPITREDPLILWECAAVSMLMLLYSPVTWGQHCVGVIPALFLISRRIIQRQPLSRWMYDLLGWFVLASLVLNRQLLSNAGGKLLESYHVETWAILGLVVIVLGLHRRVTYAKSAV
jgi:hypothetical protein